MVTRMIDWGNALARKTYDAWFRMRDRCSDMDGKYSKYYRDKGITVCEEWQDSFENFLRDMKICDDPDFSLDRIDNSKGYSKENCRWASIHVQSWNRSYGEDRGVTWYSPSNKWRARMSYGGIHFFLGYYEEKEEAIKAYKSHAKIIDELIAARILR